jgi:cytolysin (calcineurin-like family phosphatase)
VRVSPDVEAGKLHEWDSFVEDRVGLTTENFDRVAEVNKGIRKVADINALATHMGLASVCQEGDAKRRVIAWGDVAGRRHEVPGFLGR